MQETVEAFGGLDMVVANAGIAPPTATDAGDRRGRLRAHGGDRPPGRVADGARGPASDRRAPRPRRRRGLGLRLLQRRAQRLVCHEQGGRRAARPRAARRARPARRERERRLLRLHRHAHGPGRLRRPDRQALRAEPAEVGAPAPAAERGRRGHRHRHRASRPANHRPEVVGGVVGAARHHQPAVRCPRRTRRAPPGGGPRGRRRPSARGSSREPLPPLRSGSRARRPGSARRGSPRCARC